MHKPIIRTVAAAVFRIRVAGPSPVMAGEGPLSTLYGIGLGATRTSDKESR